MEIEDKPIDQPAADAREIAETLPGEKHTRLSGAWTAVVVGLLALVLILVFILQNQQSVEVSFLMFHGQLPLAVAMLFALILGSVVVFAFGAARIFQLRRVARGARRKGPASTQPHE
jgi:putative membrane protein